MLRFCRANRVDYALGVATTTTLRRHIDTLEQSTAAQRRIKLHLPTSTPDQTIFTLVLGRLPRLTV